MATIRCTAKLLNEFGTKPSVVPAEAPTLSEWHANLLRVDRKKCVLFTNDLTLYSFLIHKVKRLLPASFDELFRAGLLDNLKRDGLDTPQARHALGGRGSNVIAKTNSRSVLGSMNELSFTAKYIVHAAGGLDIADLSEVNRQVNQIIMGAIQYNTAIEELKRRLAERESIREKP